MTNLEIDALSQRLLLAEQQIAAAHREIRVLRLGRRFGGLRTVAVFSLAAVIATGTAWSVRTEAQTGPQSLTVRAPFTVVDGSGRPVATIDDGPLSFRGMQVFGAKGEDALRLQATGMGHGWVVVRSANDNGMAVISGNDTGAEFSLSDRSGFVAEISRKEAIFRAASVAVAPVKGRTFVEMKPEGTVVKTPFTVQDASDTDIVRVQGTADQRGLVVYNAQHKPVGQVVADKSGNGVLTASDGAAGNESGISFEDGEPALAMKASDGKLYAHVQRTGSRLLGPFTVTDSGDNPVVRLSDAFTEQVKDERGQGKDVTNARGVHVINAKGQTVARSAVDADGNGYLIARDSGGKGATAALIVTKGGSQMLLAGPEGKVRAAVKSGEGVMVYNAQGVAVGSIGSVNDKGYFELTDAAGEKMVESSSQPDGKGYVLVTPWQVSVAALGDPSVLRGGRKK